jgi:ABC-type branched-subunit amino acid transport system ATPase component
MTLLVDCVAAGHAAPIRVRVPAGAWAVVHHPEPDALVAALAGTEPARGGIVLAGVELAAAAAHERARRGLAVVTGRLGDLPGLRVADVLQLGPRAAPPPPVWAVMAGTDRAKRVAAEDEAAVRALAGRLGLAPWLDADASRLPPRVVALTDLVRALAGAPRAVVWRSPDWLASGEAAAARAALEAEQARQGFAVLEVDAA